MDRRAAASGGSGRLRRARADVRSGRGGSARLGPSHASFALAKEACGSLPRPRLVHSELEGLHEALDSFFPGGGNGSGARLSGRRVEVPVVRLVAAEDEREHPLRGMLAETEPEPGSPRGAEGVGTLDAARVEDRDSVPHTVGARDAVLGKRLVERRRLASVLA